MHEVSIMEGALNTATGLMKEGGGSRITRIVLTIGSLSGVVPESLDFAFRSLTSKGIAKGATLVINSIEARCRCESCGIDFDFTPNGYLCPQCGEPSMTLLQGRELELSTIEWI
ncbi:MAG: hydrogenase maturation nickel metallochaperone HypA [Akkermansia sp.]